MDNNIILTPVPVDQLLQSFRQIIKEETKAAQLNELQEKFLSPSESTKLFEPNISISTLSNWEKQGLVNKYVIGGRTWYKYSELINSVKHLERYKTKTARL